MADQPLRLDQEDLYSPRVDAYLEEHDALRRNVPDVEPQSLLVRILYSSYFYLSVAGGLGAFVGWLILEPFFEESVLGQEKVQLAALLLFPTVAGLIGLFLGAVEGIMCRNPQRAFLSAVVGLGVGFGGGLLSIFAGGTIFFLTGQIIVAADPRLVVGQRPAGGLLFLVWMMGRAAAWAVAAVPAGVGQGIALGERKVWVNGMLGAILGGLLGGLLFDPISLVFVSDDGKASASRAVGFVTIGVLVGLLIGLVEQWTKNAWLLMKAGPLAGKQFILYRNPTVLGSSPKADVYLFKDGAIEPRHALIHNRGGRFEIEDCNTPDGTYVNGIAIQRHILQPGDQVVLGKTVLEFSLREAR